MDKKRCWNCWTAQKWLKTAHAPYSKFHVGAAVLLENGKIVTGNNQGKMQHPGGLCAERVAILCFRSISNSAVKAIAVTVKPKNYGG